MPAEALTRIAVVIPALDEAANLADALATIGEAACAVVVSDGGSTDRTRELAAAGAAQVVVSPRGRALQMNAGVAGLPPGWMVVLFLHADTRLPAGWAAAVARSVAEGRLWGRFDVRLTSNRPLLRLVGALMNLRSRLTGICTGDQAIFVTRIAWDRAGGYPPIALMEDIEISRRLKRCAGAPASLRARVLVSARRWERRGVVRTITGMWALRLRHFLGESPDSLHRRYYGGPR
jgi:rSAM/selenodomain-associated transferase 2